jgi:serine/threonine protein phosphatase PrpC/predicted Ser/Thr protein kinase
MKIDRMRSGPRVTIGQHSIAGRKAANEDSFGVLVPTPSDAATMGVAFAIADGLSSSAAAKQASETVVKSFLDDYYATPQSWAVKRAVGTVLKAVNGWLFTQGQQLDSPGGLATTFSGVVLKAGTAHIFHVGDTRISLLRAGTLEPLTRDHRTRVAPAAGGLSRAVGVGPNVEIDYRTEPVETGDLFICTTDGVHDSVAAPDMLRLIGTTTDLDAAARAIVDAAYAHGSTDNLTCQIVRVDEPGSTDAQGQAALSAALPFPPDLAPGMSFEGYEILRELHAGPRGQVYLVRDQANGTTAVLKTPSVNFEDDKAYIDAFAREEWIGRLVASPHVARVLTPARPRRLLYTVIEYVDGQTLRQWIRDHPRPSLEDVRGIVEQIAAGLRAMQRKDIVHADLKADNVMIDRHGVVKLIDFGSARAAGLDETSSRQHLPAGADVTTPPEYLLGERPSHSGDIFALGVLAYEMLTGHLPFGRAFSSRRDVDRLTYVPARTRRDDLPVWVDAALEQAVAKRPSERTEALSAFTENLRRPNPALGYERPRPLLERNPLAFWRGVALAEAVAIMILLAWLAR